MENVKLSARHLTKAFETDKGEKKLVVRDVSMDIGEKQIVCILGPSGCGKSTLMKILGGIQAADEGSLLLGGQDFGVQLPRTILHRFGFVFQGDNLLQWRTAEGNLRFMLETMHLKGEKWQKRIDEMLEIVGLSQYRKIYPHELSGGMKQRVGIARALVHDPEILLLDQPFGALDAITRRMLTLEMLRIWKETQKTMVMVTNSVDEALLLAHRVYVFSPLPASIVSEIVVDIPHLERDQDTIANPRFLQLRSQLNEWIHSTMPGGEN
mgnify:FL=1